MKEELPSNIRYANLIYKVAGIQKKDPSKVSKKEMITAIKIVIAKISAFYEIDFTQYLSNGTCNSSVEQECLYKIMTNNCFNVQIHINE